MIDWAVALSTASQALKLVGELGKADKELGQAELKLKIADLTSALADLKTTLTEAKAEAASKDEEIEQLKKLNRRVKGDLVEHKGYLYCKQPDDAAKPAGNPHCPVCLQKEGLLFETAVAWSPGKPPTCPNCKGRYDHVTTFVN